MSRVVSILLTLVLPSAAHAAFYPVFQPSYVQLRPGETATLSVHAAWLSGVSLTPFTPMTFAAEDPTIATVEGSLLTTAPSPVRVTAHRPGVTRVRLVEGSGGMIAATSPLIVVAERELPVAIRVDGVLTRGSVVTLTALSDEPDAAFTWYAGRLNGLYTFVMGTGQEFLFTLNAQGPYEFWVVMTSPRGAGAAGVAVSTLEPPIRRRAVRR